MVNKIIDRKTKIIKEEKEDKINIFLYNTIIGRIILKLLITKPISKLYGYYLDSKLSKLKIKNFIIKNHINMDDYIKEDYQSFNDFFKRKINLNKRPISNDKNILISPCDAKLSVYKINNNLFQIKNSYYKLEDLTKSKDYLNYDYALIFRLCVDDYHRYCYIDNGTRSKYHHIKGVLHTVRPIAQEKYPIFSQNEREWAILHTENFQDVLQIEIGALMVGKIVNQNDIYSFKKGEEKGYFKFGASTICLLIKDVIIDQDLIDNTNNNLETIVKMGEKIGIKSE